MIKLLIITLVLALDYQATICAQVSLDNLHAQMRELHEYRAVFQDNLEDK